jgi:hypothetical protein
MKKKDSKQLTLHRETVRQITAREASVAAGGITLTCPPTVGAGTCVTCLFDSRRATCTW